MNYSKKIITVFLICIFNIAICSSCKKEEEELVVYKNFYEQDVTTFNYITTNLHSDYSHIANFVDGLVENDKYGNIVPSIASSWEEKIENGKQIWTFKIREGVYWSNYKGEIYDKVTSKDFVTSLKYMLNYKVESNNYNLAASLIENGLNYYYGIILENEDVGKLKEEAEEYCLENTCINDFDLVGVKAIDDNTLQYTLEKPTIYFLSTLTYINFLPVNEKFLKEIGFNNFGTNKKNLLYNGGYILENYLHSSKIEYKKNDNYWDKDKVYIDKIIFSREINYPSESYSRLAYETGSVDSFYVSNNDSIGWEKYVVGKDGNGSKEKPVGNNTYVINEVTDYTTYHLIFNQNRTSNKYSTLTKEEIELSNKAMKNNKFRLSLIYGLRSDIYSISNMNESQSTIIPQTFVYNDNKDYHTYFLEEYAKENNVTYDEALIREQENKLLFDKEKSAEYLNQAMKELTLKENELPIKIEFSYYYSQDYVNYDLLRIKEWNNILNGCSIDSKDCKYKNIEIVYNNKLTTYNDFLYAIANGEYNISFLGIYPNYMDPLAYLEVFGSRGEMQKYLNANEGKEIDDMINMINSYYKEEEKDKRYELCAKLEYDIILKKGLILPLTIKDTTNKVLVTNLMPYQRMKATSGLSPFKFKLAKMKEKDYTQEDIKILKEKYEKGKNK